MINARSGPRSPETVTAQPGSPREPQASAPPWAQPAQWIEAHKHLTGLCAAREAELGTLRLKAAQLVRALQLAVFPVMDQLCAETCPMCPDPCCLRAKPWFDFRDLILMHLAGLAIPEAQVLEDMTSTCRYSGPHGCTLPRSSRPWICTWYLCPAQKARLGQGPKTVRTSLTLTLQEVKKGRKELEDRFIELVCSSPGNDPRS